MKEYKVKDLLTIKNGRDHKHLGNGSFPVYGSGGIMRYADDYLYDKPSILLPRKGTLDNIQYCDTPFWCVDTTYYSEVNDELANPYYLYRYLNLLDLRNLDSGTALPSMTFESYYQIKVKLPDIETQNKIAEALYSLDQKIALNTRMNAELEAMAKQLYDYWFVQFDFPFDFAQGKPDENGKPYKSSGGKMVWNEKLKREIPEGWEVKTLKSVEDNIVTGKTPSTNEDDNFNGDIPFITIDDIRNSLYVNITGRTLSRKGAETQKNKFIPENSLCCSCIGTPGVLGFTSNLSQTNQQVNSIIFKKEHNREFVFFALKWFFSVSSAKKGNILPNMNKDEFSNIFIIYPTSDILKLFHEVVFPMFNKIKSSCSEICKLTHLRDSLLPMLMNGQVTIE